MGISGLPFNAVQLAVHVAKRLEHRLNALGLGSGNGIFEKSCSMRLDPIIRQKMHFISRTRNAIVHGSAAAAFDREAFVAAWQQVERYFEQLEAITKEPDFYSQFHAQNSQLGKKSVLDFAEELRQKKSLQKADAVNE